MLHETIRQTHDLTQHQLSVVQFQVLLFFVRKGGTDSDSFIAEINVCSTLREPGVTPYYIRVLFLKLLGCISFMGSRRQGLLSFRCLMDENDTGKKPVSMFVDNPDLDCRVAACLCALVRLEVSQELKVWISKPSAEMLHFGCSH